MGSGSEISDNVTIAHASHSSLPIATGKQEYVEHEEQFSMSKIEAGGEMVDAEEVASQSAKSEEVNQESQTVTLPFKELMIVFTGLMLAVFLSALDQTIVSVCTPKIANDFNALSEIPWVGTSYLLTSTAVQPLYGRFSDIFGRKTTFQFAISVFLVGSALCGAAQNMIMLIVARGLAGIGAGGMMSMVMIIITDLVSLRDRGRYQGMIGAAFGVSSVVGPLLGGVFTDHASWRWAFFINLPIGAVTVLTVWKVLHLPHQKVSLREKIGRIDFLGSLTLIIGLVLVLLPLNWGGSTYAWNDYRIITLFCVGALFLFIFCMIEWKQAVEPIIPFRLFKNRTNAAVFATSLFMGMGMFSMMFFLPLYFQIVKQESATASGLEMLPMIVGLLVSSIGSGVLISKMGRYRPFIWFGLICSTVGAYLLTLLTVDSGRGKQIGFLFVIGFGLGFCMQSVMLAIQSSVARKDIAVATANATFFRTVGSVLGVAIAGTVFNNGIKTHMLPLIIENPAIAAVIQNSYLATTFGADMTARILEAYMAALKEAFTVTIPVMAMAFVCSLFIADNKLERNAPPPPME